jgi:hypothetical protein
MTHFIIGLTGLHFQTHEEKNQVGGVGETISSREVKYPKEIDKRKKTLFSDVHVEHQRGGEEGKPDPIKQEYNIRSSDPAGEAHYKRRSEIPKRNRKK